MNRIGVLGAGGPAGVNTCRALQAAGHEVFAFDDNPDHRLWCQDYATVLFKEPLDVHFTADPPIDLWIAQPDSLVLWLAEHDRELPSFLPPKTTIQRCQDKAFAVRQWEREDMRSGRVLLEEPWPDSLHIAREKFGLPLWLRATQGAGARGAIKVDSLDQAYHWIRFWQARGGDMEWMAEEYFPGRDLAWSSVWYQGSLFTSFLRERVEYLYPHLTPEGLTGTPTISRIVHNELANDVAEEAVLAIDPNPHGIFSVDLREDVHGDARPTEINAGRGFTTFGLWSLYNERMNFFDWVVRLATRGYESEAPPMWDALPEGLTLSRHIDCGYNFSIEILV